MRSRKFIVAFESNQSIWLDDVDVSEAGDLRFKFWTGQIERNVTKGTPLLRHFFERAVLPADATTQRWAPQTRNTLRCKVGITRPGFLLNFLSSTVWNVAQVHDSLFRAPVVNYIEQLVWEWKSVSGKSCWVLSGEIEPSSILPATFLKVAVLNEGN